MKQTTEKIAAAMNSIGQNIRDRHPVTDVILVTVYCLLCNDEGEVGARQLWLWCFERQSGHSVGKAAR